MLAAMATEDLRGATLTTTDVVAAAPVLVLGAVAVSSLAWAHAHRHSLPAVLATSALVLAALAWLVLRPRWRPSLRADRPGVALVLAGGAVAGVMFFPGFSYGVTEKDPGGYISHAVQIARDGSYSFTDPALAHPDLPVELYLPASRLPGMWVRNESTGLMVPQFFHLWPALQATAYDVGGFGGIVGLTPLAGVASIMALVGLLRRVSGLTAAAIGGALLSTNMMEVWQAKYPTTEVLAQGFFVASLLAVVVAIHERWPPAAFVAGALTSIGFLNRADGWLLLMLSAGAIAGVAVTRRADREAAWAAAGVGVALPYALWQAYAAAARYTADNGVPSLVSTLGLLALLGAGVAVGRTLLRRPVALVLDVAARPRFQVRAGFALCAVAAVLMVVGFLRAQIFGEEFYVSEGITYNSYDELNLRRLAFFLTVPAFGVAGLGLAVVALRRWRAATWAVVLPTLVLLPIYGYKARNSTRLMWWGRRYVTHVVPGLVVLITRALVFAFFWTRRGRRPLRRPAVAAAVALTAVFLSQSLPLRSHDEWPGTFAVSERISRLSGDERGIYLWQVAPACCAAPTDLWATAVWLQRGELSVLLPREAARQVEYVSAYRRAFPDAPLFVVWTTGYDLTPPPVPGLRAVDHIVGETRLWEEHDIKRPTKARPVRYDFTVYQVP